MIGRKCFVFPDRDEWIVFAPNSRLIMRANENTADRFRDFLDTGSNLQHRESATVATKPSLFPPADVTVVCTNQCAQQCIYCYGTPAHENRSLLDPAFCHAALKLAARTAAASNRALRVFFHGVGEPTLVWPLFEECIEIARRIERDCGIRVFIRLCTGGQVSESQAEWIADQVDEVHVSLDGPRDIQNAQRPRRDKQDSFDHPLNLAQAVARKGKPLSIKATVTTLGVHRMTEIVEFVARQIGAVRLDLGMMFAPPWVDGRAAPPPWETYVAEFGKALARGAEFGVRVQHPTISYETLCAETPSPVVSHYCIVPPNIVTSFFDVPAEGNADPELGAYGWYYASTETIRFDHTKRRRLEEAEPIAECKDCPCATACHGVAGVKGRFPSDTDFSAAMCQARIGVLKHLLRHAARAENHKKERAEHDPTALACEYV